MSRSSTRSSACDRRAHCPRALPCQGHRACVVRRVVDVPVTVPTSAIVFSLLRGCANQTRETGFIPDSTVFALPDAFVLQLSASHSAASTRARRRSVAASFSWPRAHRPGSSRQCGYLMRLACFAIAEKTGAQAPGFRSEFRDFCATSDQVVGPSTNREFGGSCRDRPRLCWTSPRTLPLGSLSHLLWRSRRPTPPSS